MSCRADVKKAILDKALDMHITGRNTFRRISDNSFIITGLQDSNKTKAMSTSQAIAIAKSTLSRINRVFNGHISGRIEQADAYSPVTVILNVSDTYVEHEYTKLPAKRKTDTNQSAQISIETERNHNLNDSGLFTDHALYAVNRGKAESREGGMLVAYRKHKERMVTFYKAKLSAIKVNKRKNLTTQQLLDLTNEENKIEQALYGNKILGIKGLQDEITDMKKAEGIGDLEVFYQNDVRRVDELSKSEDINDLKEARRIIEYYKDISTFSIGHVNPLFNEEDIFVMDSEGRATSEYAISSDIRDRMEDWAKSLALYDNIIDERERNILTEKVNSDSGVKKVFNKTLSTAEILKTDTGLKDTNFLDMWLMDATQSIFSNNSIIPQLMLKFLNNKINEDAAWSRGVEEKINKITPKLIDALKAKGYTLGSLGILGINGASFDLFKETTEQGNETGGYVRRYNKKYFDEENKMKSKFTYETKKASTGNSHTGSSMGTAFLNMRGWRRKNSIIIDFTKLSEVISDPEFVSFKDQFNPNESAAYESKLKSLLGEKTYKEEIKNQKQKLRKYLSQRQFTIDSLLQLEGVKDKADLSALSKNALRTWINSHNPAIGINDYFTFGGLVADGEKVNNFMEYNSFVPRKFKPEFKGHDPVTKQFNIQDTNVDLGYYSKQFEEIESDPILSEFYDILKEVSQVIRENLPDDIQEKMAANSLPALMQTSAEMLTTKEMNWLRAISETFRMQWHRIRMNFGVNKQSEISYAIIDPVTQKKSYKVNDSNLRTNSDAITDKLLIEKAKFITSLGKKPALTKITRFSSIPLSKLKPPSLILLARYLNLDIPLSELEAGNSSKIRAITGDKVEVGKYIRDHAIHSIVQTQSFDLPRLLKYFSNVTMAYKSRQELLPVMEIMKKYYSGILDIDTTITGKEQYNSKYDKFMPNGLRDNAIRQINNWFDRAVLGNYNSKHTRAVGFDNTQEIKDDTVVTKVPILGNIIYSPEDRKTLKEIDALLGKGSNLTEEQAKALEGLRNKLGKERTVTAGFENLWSWIRTLALGYNLPSALTNLMEGTVSNMILASSGEYFNPNEIYYGYHVAKLSFLKNITFGLASTGPAKKNRSLVDKFRVIMDSANELQKSSFKTLASKFQAIAPHEINRRTEFLNQSPIMIAILRTMKIKDKNGKESTIWDAYNDDGHLKDEFKTEANVLNWEELQGQDYLDFKVKLNSAIVKAHGNYDELRGMMLKSYIGGKAVMMFKTWITSQYYWRFGNKQEDVNSGIKEFKGRYYSYSAGTAALHGAVGGLAVGGFVGAAIGGLGGAAFGAFFGTKSEVGLIKETAQASLLLVKKLIGMPVNMTVGRKVIGNGAEAFNDWIKPGGKFTEQDARNLRSNMADIAIQLTWLMLTLAAKAMFWDDDDEKDSPERIAHNIIVNKATQFSRQAFMYANLNPTDLFKSTIGSNAVVQYITELFKWADKLGDALLGLDTTSGGSNTGESALYNQSKKILLPGLFKEGNPLLPLLDGDIPMLGFEKFGDRVFEESPLHQYFRSPEYKDKQINKKERSGMRLELNEKNDKLREEERLTKKEIEAIINEELPTPAKLKKLEMTREEYEETQKEE